MRPQDDDFPEVLEATMQAICDHGIEAGAEALAPIAHPRREVPPRPTISRGTAARIFHRDRFHCRYCDGKTVFQPVSRLLGSIYPDAYPFHPNWKSGQTHPAVIARSPVIDHVVPGTQGGSWTDTQNLVTACWPCNAVKADFTLGQLGWTLRPVNETSDWDGLTRFYRTVWEIAGRPDASHHESWLRALDSVPRIPAPTKP